MKVGWATCLIWIFSCACLWLAGHFFFHYTCLEVFACNNEVYLCGRKDILYGDSDIYYVKKHSIYMADGHWAACIEAYGVWECEDVVIHFQLVDDGQAQ